MNVCFFYFINQLRKKIAFNRLNKGGTSHPCGTGDLTGNQSKLKDDQIKKYSNFLPSQGRHVFTHKESGLKTNAIQQHFYRRICWNN